MKIPTKKGYVIVLTGDGKGKTTAALGMAMRAIGHGFKVSMIQFIKGTMWYGELNSSKNLFPALEIKPLGRGFVHINPSDLPPEDVEAARKALKACEEEIYSGSYFMVILDEINNAIDYGLLSANDVLTMLENRPPTVNIVLTGRGAAPEVVAIADLVTEMKEVKHPFQQGEGPRSGIEF